MRSFTYAPTAQRVVFGRGTVDSVAEEVQRLPTVPYGEGSAGDGSRDSSDGPQRILVVATRGGRPLGVRVQTLLGARCAGLYAGAVMHTPVAVSEDALGFAKRNRVDALVAVGGGSAIGLAKALALKTGLPQLVIPTTYSGSEATATVGQTEYGKKTTARADRVVAKTVIYDVDLTNTLGKGVVLTSGINAVAHAVEAIYASDSNPITDQLSVQGIRTMIRALDNLGPSSEVSNDATEAQSDALYAAWLCASCLAATSMGLHHKLCHVLGGKLNTPHSETHAILLPHTLQYNFAAASAEAQKLLAEALTPDTTATGTVEEQARAVACTLYDFLKKSGNAAISLQQLGVQEVDLDSVAETAATSAPYPNPAPLDQKRLRALLQRAYLGTRPDTDF